MSRNISNSLKKLVDKRANFKCEYCLLADKLSFYSFHIEHIRSVKHGGNDSQENLAYCCPECNFAKGSDIATFVGESDEITRFFNPRIDNWDYHFMVSNSMILGKTPIGKATEQIFRFNDIERLIFRKQLAELGLYP